jgi:hypothetical protein
MVKYHSPYAGIIRIRFARLKNKPGKGIISAAINCSTPEDAANI